jgi:hypothetical protein
MATLAGNYMTPNFLATEAMHQYAFFSLFDMCASFQ